MFSERKTSYHDQASDFPLCVHVKTSSVYSRAFVKRKRFNGVQTVSLPEELFSRGSEAHCACWAAIKREAANCVET